MNYVYNGPVSGVTLGRPGSREVMLRPGKVIDLPGDHPYVKTLAARGFLTACPAAERPAMRPVRKTKPQEAADVS